jgi:pimeloyl-ACP methyl ester carboxylesterase
MTMLVLVHGGCHAGWCFDLLRPELDARGLASVAVDLPYDDPDASLLENRDVLSTAVDDADDEVVLVAHSMGGHVAPLLGDHPSVQHLVLLCASMHPGLVGLDFVASTVPMDALERDELGRSRFRSRDALREHLYQDCSDDVVDWAWARLTPMAMRIAMDPYPITEWPDVATTSIVCRADGAVSGEFSHAAAKNIGAPVVELEGSHSPFAAKPAALADVLVGVVDGA